MEVRWEVGNSAIVPWRPQVKANPKQKIIYYFGVNGLKVARKMRRMFGWKVKLQPFSVPLAKEKEPYAKAG